MPGACSDLHWELGMGRAVSVQVLASDLPASELKVLAQPGFGFKVYP